MKWKTEKIKKSNNTQNWVFEKINKLEKPLAKEKEKERKRKRRHKLPISEMKKGISPQTPQTLKR